MVETETKDSAKSVDLTPLICVTVRNGVCPEVASGRENPQK